MDDDEKRQQVALFRYGLIAPVLHQTIEGTAAEYFRKATAGELAVPYLGKVRLKPSTLKSWLADYRAGGLDRLEPRRRIDLGSSRVITPVMAERLEELLKAYPRMSGTLVRDRLIEEGIILSESPSETTIRRFIRDHALRVRPAAPTERRSFAKQVPNELWTIDFMYGPSLADGSVPRLLAAIDDASRFIVLGRFLRSESYADLAPALLEAFIRYGVPQAIYCDNGAAFSTADLALACARLDVALIHSKPYVPESRGKIERFFLTVRTRVLSALEPSALASLEALNHAFDRWLDADYHRREHSALSASPLSVFLHAPSPRRFLSRQELELHFQRTLRRLVRRDGTVSVAGIRYEVPAEWVGKTVELRSPIDDLKALTLFVAGKPAVRLSPLDPVGNEKRNHVASFAGGKR
jgi:transposase InsO family protein